MFIAMHDPHDKASSVIDCSRLAEVQAGFQEMLCSRNSYYGSRAMRHEYPTLGLGAFTKDLPAARAEQEPCRSSLERYAQCVADSRESALYKVS
jgi:hypothetical protein